jgi:hypothetical protein
MYGENYEAPCLRAERPCPDRRDNRAWKYSAGGASYPGVSIAIEDVITQSEVTGHHYYQSSRTIFRFLPGLGITHVAGYLFENFSPVIQVFYQSSLGFGLSLGITER